MARVGATRISPDVSSGNLTAPSLPGTQADIEADTQLSGGITYMVTDHWSVDLPLALPYKHEIVGAGAIAGVGKIGEVRALPITLFGQYRFGAPAAKFRPYLGAGPTYVKFYHERGTAALSALTGMPSTTLTVGSKLALTVQAGATMALNDRWFVDAMVAKTFLKTRTTLSSGQTLDIKSDPLTLALSVGYRF
jgi:outer membrane protein